MFLAYTESLYNSTIRRQFKMSQGSEETLPKIPVAKPHKKTLLSIRKVPIKTPVRCCFTPTRPAIISGQVIASIAETIGGVHVDGVNNSTAALENYLLAPQKLGIQLLYDLAIGPLGLHPREVRPRSMYRQTRLTWTCASHSAPVLVTANRHGQLEC